MIVCGHCGLANPDGARECGLCGQPLEYANQTFPLATFVGRSEELAALLRQLEEAASGRGGLVMLAGEAGVGKTRLARELCEIARQRGAVVLWGACYEGDWQPPYGPWLEALGQCTLSLDSELLQNALGPGASPLAQLVPEIRRECLDRPAPAQLTSEEERFRLHDAVSQFLLAVAREKPVLLVLDDLHWADPDSLRLLRHVLQFLARARVLIVGIYRDLEIELAPRHLLGDTLALIKREADYRRLTLRGLAYEDVNAYLSLVLGGNFPKTFAEVIYRETNGNPFYMREIVAHLIEERNIRQSIAPDWGTPDFSVLRMPPSIREVVNHRLAHLSSDTATVLRFASAFTRGFTLEVLQALTGMPEDNILASLDEALRAGFIRSTASTAATYDFEHAIVRHTIYGEWNPDRRVRLHRRVAHALERVYAGREKEHAAELAAQYHASVGLGGASKGIPYALVAAEQARAASAPAQAVAYLRMAREMVQDLLRDKPDESALHAQVDVLRRLAIAEGEALLWEDAKRSAEETLSILEEAGEGSRERCEFLVTIASVLKDGGAPLRVWEPLVERGLAMCGQERDLLWAGLMLLRNRFEPLVYEPVHGGRWLGDDPQAAEILRREGDEDDYARTLGHMNWRTRQETEAMLALARTWRRPTAIMRVLDAAARDLMYRHGAYRQAAQLLEELLDLAQQHGSLPMQAEALAHLALFQAASGGATLAQRTAQLLRETVTRMGSEHRARFIWPGLECELAYLLGGDWPKLAQAVTDFMTKTEASHGPVGLVAAACAALSYARAGDNAAAHQSLDALTRLVDPLPPTTYGLDTVLADASIAVWELEAVEYVPTYRRLALGLYKIGAKGSPFSSTSLCAARMTALAHNLSEAQEHFSRAREEAESVGLRALRAIVDYDEAIALRRAGIRDSSRIAALLDDAARAFRALDMLDWAQRADKEREKLGTVPSGSDRYPDRLTAREVEVLLLVAAGKTNREIAEQLVLSLPTVQRHIANIYIKISARNRADATAYALRHGLVPTS